MDHIPPLDAGYYACLNDFPPEHIPVEMSVAENWRSRYVPVTYVMRHTSFQVVYKMVRYNSLI